MLAAESLNYILSFLIRQEISPAKIGYTSDTNQFSQYKVVIKRSHFFDKNVFGQPQSMPLLPLKQLHGVPILFGENTIETVGNTLVINADLVASAFFLLSRYEETIHFARDEHGRFRGKSSLPFKAGFIHRPVVEEYGQLLRNVLRQAGVRVQEPTEKITNIYLTHDVDVLCRYRSLRGTLGGLKRIFLRQSDEHLKNIYRAWRKLENDAAYTFPWLFSLNETLPHAHKICFVKAGLHQTRFDRPLYNLQKTDSQNFKHFCQAHNVAIELHASYASGEKPALIAQEKQHLENAFRISVSGCRHHFLRSCEPQDMQALINANITDDYTMTYADVAGFRLGTCRAVRWLNPRTTELTPLTLHPLAVMDCSLSAPKYMGMNFEDAYIYCRDLIDQTYLHGGEVVLLWHNTIFTPQNYHKELYISILNYLTKK